jgi:hypothetical protein
MGVRSAGVLRLGRRRFEPWQLLVMAVAPGPAAEGGQTSMDSDPAVFGWLGARVFRVQRVRETRRALSMVSAIRGDIPPAYAVRGLA